MKNFPNPPKLLADSNAKRLPNSLFFGDAVNASSLFNLTTNSNNNANTSSLFGRDDGNTSLFGMAPESPQDSSDSISNIFVPDGFEYSGEKTDGESSGFFLRESANKENEYLVKQNSIITEFIGLTVYREMLAILGSSIVVPDFSLQKDSASSKTGLFIKMIPGYLPNSEVRSVHAAPTKRKPKFPGAAYRDLVLMMVTSMLIGDNDCSPDNSGSKDGRGVRIDFGNAFYWVYNQDGDFKQKLRDYFTAFYSERSPYNRFENEFMQLSRLSVLGQPGSLLRINQALQMAVNILSTFISKAELQATVFQNESIATNGRVIVDRKYESFEELRGRFSEMLTTNINRFLPIFLAGVNDEIAALNEMRNAIDSSPPRDYSRSSALDTSMGSPVAGGSSSRVFFGNNLSPISNYSSAQKRKQEDHDQDPDLYM
ncbi:MAG: hypothetical protein ACHP6I_02470 [Rickettsiales bacterium]